MKFETRPRPRCERCGERLNEGVYLELSQTDGKYYEKLPEGHTSQGAFVFGKGCAKTQLKETAAKPL